MESLTLIGIGTGSPDHVTLEGVAAMRALDLVLLPRKGPAKDDLAELRLALLRAHAPDVPVVAFEMPERVATGDYRTNVESWHDRIAEAWLAALPSDAGHVGLLVWGDPSLYDSTLRIAARLPSGPETRVVPGITALQALTAAHAIPLNAVNAPVTITTGRRLRVHGWPVGVERVAVMLDGDCSFQSLDEEGLTIWWGAYLGLPKQVLCHGAVTEVGPNIVALRQEARAAHGWIMDTYLLERTHN